MQRRYQVVHYRTDYLLGVDRFLYQNVLVWYVRHNMDPYLVLGCLLGAPVQEYTRYFGNKRRFSLWTPQKASDTDRLFAELCRVVSNPPWR